MPIPPVRVKCTDAECTHYNSEVEVHEDTVIPVLCGGCGKSMVCPHAETEMRAALEGTVGSPLHVVREVCRVCGAGIDERRNPMTADQVSMLPASVLLGGPVPTELAEA